MTSPHHPSPGPDVSCRVAWTDDAAAVAAVQVRAWRADYVDLLPRELLESMSAEDLAAHWHESLARPPEARHRVLVALERALVTGFALTGPSPDPDADPVADGEVTDLTVDVHKRGQGHGSRLLQACADTLRADRFVRARTWINSEDDARREFLTGAGWGPDGAHRTLDLLGDGSVLVKQVRLHTALIGGEEG